MHPYKNDIKNLDYSQNRTERFGFVFLYKFSRYIKKLPILSGAFCLLSIKTISADKFTNDTCGRDFVLDVRLANVVEKSNHCAHLLVALIRRIYLLEKGIDVFLNHRKLVERGAIEDNVGVFLIGEYPFFLTASYGIPHIERSLNTRATAFEVTNCATKKSKC